jgi:hypothetical protein
MHLMETACVEGTEQVPRGQGPVAGFIEHGNESDSFKKTYFLARVE